MLTERMEEGPSVSMPPRGAGVRGLVVRVSSYFPEEEWRHRGAQRH